MTKSSWSLFIQHVDVSMPLLRVDLRTHGSNVALAIIRYKGDIYTIAINIKSLSSS